MYNSQSKKITEPRKVKALPPEVARKIAAGEVIDRPNAVLREFLDNAIDANADRIIVEIEGGGIDSIRVVDNGWGMSKEDLEVCARPHVTSKIATEDDLENLYTLGFRGEALASIAAVSRLSITSARNENAWKLESYLEQEHDIQPASLHEGTIAQSKALFENFPARRQFLKRPQSEGSLAKQIFIEKALPFTNIAFRLTMDGKIRLDLAKNQTLAQRFTSVLDIKEKESLFYEVKEECEAWNVRVILGEPSVYRNDRKQMYIYVNGRRVQEFAFLQALDYGAEGFFPNGSHPVACLFIDIDPKLVDFNIHPAKKEVRFKDIGSVHKTVSSLVRNFYRDFSVKALLNDKTSENNSHSLQNEFSYPTSNPISDFRDSNEKVTEYKPKAASLNTFSHPPISQEQKVYPTFSSPNKNTYMQSVNSDFNNAHSNYNSSNQTNFRYIGTALDVFLIVEKNNELYMVDQHAGHERVLYESFMKTSGQKQGLLIPLVIETLNKEDDDYIESIASDLEKAGFSIVNCSGGRWEVSTVPIKWQGTEKDLQEDLLEKRLNADELIRKLAEKTACRSAVKDGHILDPNTAEKLLVDIFSLEDPHCPHGRPLWTKISKQELFEKVRRT